VGGGGLCGGWSGGGEGAEDVDAFLASAHTCVGRASVPRVASVFLCCIVLLLLVLCCIYAVVGVCVKVTWGPCAHLGSSACSYIDTVIDAHP